MKSLNRRSPYEAILQKGKIQTSGSRCLYDDADCSSTSIGRNSDRQLTNREPLSKPSTTSPLNFQNYQQLATHPNSFRTQTYNNLSTKQDNGSTNSSKHAKLDQQPLTRSDETSSRVVPAMLDNVTERNSEQGGSIKFTLNLSLAVGASLVLVMVVTGLLWVFYRYKKRGEGSYKLDATEHNYFAGPTYNMTSQHTKTTDPKKGKLKKSLSREWYVWVTFEKSLIKTVSKSCKMCLTKW